MHCAENVRHHNESEGIPPEALVGLNSQPGVTGEEIKEDLTKPRDIVTFPAYFSVFTS